MRTIFLVFNPYVVRRDFIEITKTSIIKELKECLKYHKFNITLHDKNQLTNDLSFLKNFLTHIWQIEFDVNDSKEILCTLSASKKQVKKITKLYKGN